MLSVSSDRSGQRDEKPSTILAFEAPARYFVFHLQLLADIHSSQTSADNVLVKAELEIHSNRDGSGDCQGCPDFSQNAQ